MAHGRVDLHGIDPEGAVAIDGDHLPMWECERGRDRKRHADAETAECPGIHVGRRRQADASEAQEIAAVRDRDAMCVTLTIAQARCTELVEEVRALRARLQGER